MDLVPESIQGATTIAIDDTWALRLSLLNYRQLRIDLANETNIGKLTMWLEMFGISPEMIPNNLTTAEYQRLLQSIVIIYRLSGTRRSMQLLGYVLGASSVTVVQDYTLRYNAHGTYNALYKFDGGAEYRPFVVRLEIEGVSQEKQAGFWSKMRQLFELFEPAWIYLEGPRSNAFPLQFPFEFT